MKKKGRGSSGRGDDDDVFDPLKAAAAEAESKETSISNDDEIEEDAEESDIEDGFKEKKTNDASCVSNPNKPKVRGKSRESKRG